MPLYHKESRVQTCYYISYRDMKFKQREIADKLIKEYGCKTTQIYIERQTVDDDTDTYIFRDPVKKVYHSKYKKSVEEDL